MTYLNNIASFVDTIGCRNFNLTHKKVMRILTRNQTSYTPFLRTCWFNIMKYTRQRICSVTFTAVTHIGISLKCIDS